MIYIGVITVNLKPGKSLTQRMKIRKLLKTFNDYYFLMRIYYFKVDKIP